MSGYEITLSVTALCPCCGKELPFGSYLTESRVTGHPLDRDNPYERKDRRVFITPCADCFGPRAAVAELIEADKAYDDARRRWSGEKYEGDDYGVHGSDFIRCLCCEGESGAGILNHGVTHEPDCEVAALERAESRRSAALARAGGAS